MAHVCEDDGTATTIVVALPHAACAPAEAPTQRPPRLRTVESCGDGAPRLVRAEQRRPEPLKPAA